MPCLADVTMVKWSCPQHFVEYCHLESTFQIGPYEAKVHACLTEGCSDLESVVRWSWLRHCNGLEIRILARQAHREHGVVEQSALFFLPRLACLGSWNGRICWKPSLREGLRELAGQVRCRKGGRTPVVLLFLVIISKLTLPLSGHATFCLHHLISLGWPRRISLCSVKVLSISSRTNKGLVQLTGCRPDDIRCPPICAISEYVPARTREISYRSRHIQRAWAHDVDRYRVSHS